MRYDYTVFEGKQYCNVFTDRTQMKGILRFTHEISVTFVLENGEWKFNGGCHIGVFDADWRADEQDSFEQTFPNLLKEMMDGLE